MSPHPPKLHHSKWTYPNGILKHRWKTIANGALLLFCLLSLVTLSLLFAENTYLTTLADAKTGKHHGVLYRLTGREYAVLLDNMDKIDAAFTVVPVYGFLEDIESEKPLLGITVLTEQMVKWYALTWDGTLTDDGILLPPSLPEREPYYRGNVSRSFFFHGEDSYGNRTDGTGGTGSDAARNTIARELTILDTLESCDDTLPYAFVTVDTAEDILSATSGTLLYDVYFTTPHTSDYAAALVVDTLVKLLDRDSVVTDTDKIREVMRRDTGDPQWQGRRQVRYDSYSRQIRYMDFIHYELLALLGREYMDDPVFFFLMLPAIIAAAFAMSGFLRDDTTAHMDEYGLLKASGTGAKTLYGMVYAQALWMLVLALPVVLLGTAIFAALYDNATAALFRPVTGMTYAFPMPWGNLFLICLYVFLLTCFLIWLYHRRLFAHTPTSLLTGHITLDQPEIRTDRAAAALTSADPIGMMAKVLFRRERRQRILETIPTAFVMGACGFLFGTMLLSGTGGIMGMVGILYLCGAWLLLSVQGVLRDVEQNRRTFAILQQCGTAETTIWHHWKTTRRQKMFLCMKLTGGMFGILFLLPVLLGGWIFGGTPLYRFLSSPAYVTMVVLSCGISILLLLCDMGLGLVMMKWMKRMQKGVHT